MVSGHFSFIDCMMGESCLAVMTAVLYTRTVHLGIPFGKLSLLK